MLGAFLEVEKFMAPDALGSGLIFTKRTISTEPRRPGLGLSTPWRASPGGNAIKNTRIIAKRRLATLSTGSENVPRKPGTNLDGTLIKIERMPGTNGKKTETDSPQMIEPRIPSIEKTSGNSIEGVTNIADPTLSPNRKY